MLLLSTLYFYGVLMKNVTLKDGFVIYCENFFLITFYLFIREVFRPVNI